MGRPVPDFEIDPWRLDRVSRQVAVFASVGFLAGAFLAVLVDVVTAENWDAGIVQGWTLVPQLAAAAGLFYVGWMKSRSLAVMGLLVGVIIVEETFHVMNPLAIRLVDFARASSEWTGLRFGVLVVGLIYGVIALIGFAMILIAYRKGSVSERRVVRNLALMLIVGGVFGGPIGAAGALGNPRRWLFIEEFGEAAVFAVIAGYTAGLVMLVRPRRGTREQQGLRHGSDLPPHRGGSLR